MYDLRRFGIKPGLETIKSLLDRLGNPQDHFPAIHIAGTNGKGSIASSLAAILKRCGLKTGLYTSPHLIDFNERIRINGHPITNKQVLNAYQAVKNAAGDRNEATFFEYTTAMAFYEFNRQQVDCAVIETGMGGRLDATNVVNPLLSIISNIALEHQQYLGNNPADIATEKGGIIKFRKPVITGVRQKDALAVLQQLADQKKAPLYHLGDHFDVEKFENGSFDYCGISHRWKNVQTGLLGQHQIENAALVLAACELLLPWLKSFCELEDGILFSEGIQPALADHRWPGRLEWITGKPPILLDGAHNLNAAAELGQFLTEISVRRKCKIFLVTGILDDKPYDAMLRCWLPLCRRVIVTQSENERSVTPQKLYQSAITVVKDVTVIPNITDAVACAIETALPEDLICIAGSLYVIGEAKKALNACHFNNN